VRVKTGIKGFDELIQGGLPAGSTVVLEGPSGIEKDYFAGEFLAEGLKAGEAVLIVISSKPPTTLFEELRAKGFDPDKLFEEGRLRVVDWYSQKEESVVEVEEAGPVIKVSLDLLNVGIAITRAIASLAKDKPKRAVIEILSPALSAYELSQVHTFAQATKAKLSRQNVTSIFVIEKEMHDSTTLSTLLQPFDGVIDMDRVREGDRIVRKLAVFSLKGTATQSNYVPFEVTNEGAISVGITGGIRTGGEAQKAEMAPKPPQRASRIFRILERSESRLKDNPKDADALFSKATALASLQRFDDSMNTLNELTRLSHRYPGLWLLKSKIYTGLGDEQKAKLCLERSAQIEDEIEAEEDATRKVSDLACPLCGAPVRERAEACPSCGITFGIGTLVKKPIPTLSVRPERRPEPKPEISKIAPAPPEKTRIRKEVVTSAPKGRTNGLTNGLGKVKGLTNGLRGRYNGLADGL